jgi:curli biogenesis system outer membrane secretion channel CsgG
MKRLALLVTLAAVAAPAAAQTSAPGTRKRIAVIDFDYATVHSYVHDIWGSNVDVGKGVADMLVNQLVRNGTYSVVERKQLDRILQEQNFQQSGRADASTAAQLGRILGVDAIVIGSITQFGRDDKKLGVGGGVRVGGVGIGGIGRRSAKAVVGIDARIVDVRTAEILGVATGFGESKRSGATLLGGASVGGVAAGGAVDMSSSNFASTILGEATRLAVDSLVTELVGAQSRITETVAAIQALVADVTETEIIINKGTRDGVRVGAEYDIVRGGREIRDPASGRVLRRMTEKVGKVKITQADEQSAVGTVSGAPVRVGDCVGTCPVKP